MNAAWQSNIINGQTQSYVQSITQLANSIGKPVIFTETGVASFPGANDRWNYHDSVIAEPTTQSDYAAQAYWWASFFDTWAVHKPSWLTGIFIWDNDPGVPTGSVYDKNGYNINGKPAELVISSWFGGKDYLSSSQSSFTGSVANDQIYLYGNQIGAANGNPITQPQTFATTISLTIDGTIIKGNTPTVHFYVNGFDEGAKTLSNTPGTYVDPKGVTWTVSQTFTFTLNGLVNISELKVAIDSPVNVGGVENSQTFISSVAIDGVALTQATYNPLQGPSQQLTITTGGQYDGGNEVIDASPWNAQLAGRDIGTAANRIQVNGGGGTDTVHVLGSPSNYTIALVNGNTVALTENAGLDQNAILTNISYNIYNINFQSGATVSLSTVPAVAVEGSMYGAVGSSAEVILLTTQFLPGQIANAALNGLNPLVYACEVVGLAFAFGNEAGSSAFSTAFGPSNAAMPATVAGDAAFAAAAASAIFGSAATANTPGAIHNFVSNWEAFYTSNGIPGIPNATANQIDLAARGAAWGDAVGVALANNLGPLDGQAGNFLNDAAHGTAIYSAPLTSQPTAAPLQGAATGSAATTASHVQLTGVAAPIDHIVM